MMAMHHAKVLERQLPAPPTHHIHGSQGTRVTVRNLFGNLPVRVKQRSVMLEQKSTRDCLWDSLKRDVTCLLLSWQGPVSLRIRDENNRLLFNLNASALTETPTRLNTATTNPRSAQLSSLLNILTQAGYVGIDDWAMWVPVSASTATVSIKGAFSLDPAPTKHVQFISLDIQPLSADAGHNELYDQVNRLFALSSFGSIEHDDDVDEPEKIRRQSDKRFKKDGYTARQLKARKGVDKYPMFHLRISFKNAQKLNLPDERFVSDETNLQAVVSVLDAMITQWLSVHHFRPRKPRTNQIPYDNSVSAGSEPNKNSDRLTPGLLNAIENRSSKQSTPRPSSIGANTRKRKRLPLGTVENPSEKMQSRAFAEWSRIKSSKAEFFNSTSKAVQENLSSKAFRNVDHANKPASPSEAVQGSARFNVEPLLLVAFNRQPSLATSLRAADDESDETMLWVDPSTKKTYTLNARTGCVVSSAHSRPHTDSSAPMFASVQPEMRQPLRLTTKPTTAEAKETPWLDGVLQSWNNPIFNPSEKRIQQLSLQEREHDQRHHRQPQHSYCSRIDIDKAFSEASTTGSSRLSKEGLQSAQVLAQLDKKFILVKMQNLANSVARQEASTAVLVLIDQHAADERIQVENLLKELCIPPIKSHPQSGYQSKLGHASQVNFSTLGKPIQFTISPQERIHFTTHAARFAAWGILFDILETKSPTGDEALVKGHLLSVTTLPPGIAERCKTDAQLLVSFLRSTVWTYVETPHLPSLLSFGSDDDPSIWVRRMASCPQGLLDLINSRACRSAIMFNDKLSLSQCKNLVQKLARCVFPFMCAHGRPSMVPLVDLGCVGHVEEGSSVGAYSEQVSKGFVQAWKGWKGR